MAPDGPQENGEVVAAGNTAKEAPTKQDLAAGPVKRCTTNTSKSAWEPPKLRVLTPNGRPVTPSITKNCSAQPNSLKWKDKGQQMKSQRLLQSLRMPSRAKQLQRPLSLAPSIRPLLIPPH